MNFLQQFCFKREKLLQLLPVLFPNLLSRPSHGQHRRGGGKTELCKTGLPSSPRGRAPGSVGPVFRVLSPLSVHISSCSSSISLPSNFLYKTHSLPSVLDPNEAIFSDSVSGSINDQEEFMSSVWKLSDLTSLLSLFSLILSFTWRVRSVICFLSFSYWFSIWSTLYYSHVFLS